MEDQHTSSAPLSSPRRSSTTLMPKPLIQGKNPHPPPDLPKRNPLGDASEFISISMMLLRLRAGTPMPAAAECVLLRSYIVALVETKMEEHRYILDVFSFTDMSQVLAQSSLDGCLCYGMQQFGTNPS
ncbi:hypothetical protein HAX54_031750 [Datura stramonium]|uniref:Uncharacterized protein n=1 Tax=Datura stramonium TaxID=4076 RepID=A0ABS8SC45_DATST|nr:hypothetical protein [Datura stramonium]